MTAPMAALRPVWASETTNCPPVSPLAFRERKNAVQNAPSSESPTSRPSTSRPPSVVTRSRHHRAADHPAIPAGLEGGRVHNRYGKPVCDSERDRNTVTSASNSAQIRLTSDLEIPASTPRALTRSSTLRVEVPCT
jgi:hypothetical protein